MLNPLELRTRLTQEALPRLAAALRRGNASEIAEAERDCDALTSAIAEVEELNQRSVEAARRNFPPTKPEGGWSHGDRW